MIGNDIIDLKAIQERSPAHWQRYRDKTMTVAEQDLLACRRYNLRRTERPVFNKLLVSDQVGNNMDIWLAWSVKESVYKLEFQLEQQRYFAPKQIQVVSLEASNFQGLAKGKLGTYNFEVQLKNDFLHALAWQDSSKKPHFHCLALGTHTLNDHLTEAIGKKFPGQKLQYQALPFPHFILDNNRGIPVSKSHHGNWQAFAY